MKNSAMVPVAFSSTLKEVVFYAFKTCTALWLFEKKCLISAILSE